MSERPQCSERGPIRIDRHPPNQIHEQWVSIYAESGPAEGEERGS
jgi:hypothetical protein